MSAAVYAAILGMFFTPMLVVGLRNVVEKVVR